MTSAMDDFFGANPSRPDHPDFWRLSEVLLDLDGTIDPTTDTQEQMDAAFDKRLAEIGVDQESLVYAGMQRAMRVCGVATAADLFTTHNEVRRVCAAWLDAFTAGALYERRSR